ncbi:MAG TPA: OmpW family outer membrane protein [Thermoanaerobaculia bacterium]|nr:OmpW family outer membrane protein [Thermoanaerobaculia bacterium]
MKSLRIILVILAVAVPLSLSAQTHELSVFLSDPHIGSSSISFEGTPITINADFDEQIGYGAAYNHFFTDRVSAEFAVQRISADTTLNVFGGGVNTSFDAGDLDLTVITGVAQWHFRTDSSYSPYVGLGVAYVSGDTESPVDVTDPTSPSESVDLESTTSGVLNAGIDFHITPRVAVGIDAKYFTYDAKEDAPDAEPLSLDTLVMSASLKLRF